MSGISIGIKEFEFPQWVNDIYNQMTPKDRELNTKANIYGSCNKTENGYEIIPFICSLSNRISVLPKPKDVAIAISLADCIFPWEFLPGNSLQDFVCKHCGFKFKSRLKQPQCQFCHKYQWQESKVSNVR